jgi:tRNA dimethylallyltransferase
MTQNSQNPHILVIYGPTGVGKTDFALEVAAGVPAEIINMDVGQFYTPLSIGTAKPDWQSFATPHHLFDIIDRPENFTVTEYRRVCAELIQDIWSRGKLPILVGGSGFYLKSLFFPPLELENSDTVACYKNPSCDSQLSLDKAQSLDTGVLWESLFAIDPIRAQELNKTDRYRIMRALTIFYETGKKPSDCKPVYAPICSATIIFLTRDRKELYSRINTRVELMMENGWVGETQALLGTPWEQFALEKKLIGYNEIIAFLRESDAHKFGSAQEKIEDKEEKWHSLVAAIAKRTRHYAKRQHTFWNMLLKLFAGEHAGDKEIKTDTVNLTLMPGDLYINRLISTLTPLLKKKEQL